MEDSEATQTIKVLTPKELKAIAKPEFAQNPDKFYPTKKLRDLGFTRSQCPSCGANFWRASDDRKTCGDSLCEGKYTFIGQPRGIGKERKITPKDAWDTFEAALTSTSPACTPIKRYPVTARWRDDVDFVQAGIYCFQPYCVTGELQPPANPLICPQFCVRFNDLDNIGVTGRHYSGFVMLGIQAFNNKAESGNRQEFWMDECVEGNYRWLTEHLKIPKDEITFIEDVWAGGGNLGPSVEFFVNGLEVGNMVFMQFKTFPDGHREELDVRVIDVGIGLERIPWLVNGSPTSYLDVFPSAYKFFQDTISVPAASEVWESFGALSCLLNADEVDDLNKTWQNIANEMNIGLSAEETQKAIEPVRDLYVVLDHTRTVLMAIQDGALPANTGGGSNIRNVIRRAFAAMKRNGWDKKVPDVVDFLLQLCEQHKNDLALLYGPFEPYSSFADIIRREYQLYTTHDVEQRKKLDNILKKKKVGADGKKLTLDDWIQCITGNGIAPDLIEEISGEPQPLNLWLEIDYRQQQTMKIAAPQLYSTALIEETVNLYDDNHNHREYGFKDAKILDVLPVMSDPKMPLGIVILDKSPFYPTSGGQDHDTGVLYINGKEYQVVDVIKSGPCVLHQVSPPLSEERDALIGTQVHGYVDAERRDQLRIHHTATHIIYATARRVLGPHVWQNGARKKVTEAHLDITHYSALTHEQLREIEIEANKIVRSGKDIKKSTQAKDEAEKKYGFHLYQGGVVPGNSLRIVDIEGTDTEACCGTHCDNTSEVGFIKVISARRVTDGIVRLTYVAGDRALEEIGRMDDKLHTIATALNVQNEHVVDSSIGFFKQALALQKRIQVQGEYIFQLEMKVITNDTEHQLFIIPTTEQTASLYVSKLPPFYQQLKDQKKVVLWLSRNYIYGFSGDNTAFDVSSIATWLNENRTADIEKLTAAGNDEAVAAIKPVQVTVRNEVQAPAPTGKGKVKIGDVSLISCFQLFGYEKLLRSFEKAGFSKIKFQ